MLRTKSNHAKFHKIQQIASYVGSCVNHCCGLCCNQQASNFSGIQGVASPIIQIQSRENWLYHFIKWCYAFHYIRGVIWKKVKNPALMGSRPRFPFGLEDKAPEPPGCLILEDLETLHISTNKRFGHNTGSTNHDKSQACYNSTRWFNNEMSMQFIMQFITGIWPI